PRQCHHLLHAFYKTMIKIIDLDKLFDKFYRVGEDRSSQTGGTGLGLAIAKSIVELHSGSITVKSDYNGTEFKLVLYKNLELNDDAKF
ncbi:MAG: cell wall metabolism sensor histidine kinase WalK, partial [Lachnospiraceae bacterium]|nr:cell wall metabolism sensor histidine kinase WalK [Lachnospiraceae bacterium]